MVPMVVAHAEHVATAYRPAVGTVKLAGTDALESADRVSFTP
jgi:hypothetical protein